MTTVAVCSGKGAPGATFVAVNLSPALARSGQPVMLLDLDPAGGDVAAYLGLDPRRGLFPLLRMNAGVPDGPAIAREAEEAAGVLAVAGFPEPFAAAVPDVLASVMGRAAGDGRVVVADLGRVDEASATVAKGADLCIVVARPDLVSVLGAERAIRLLEGCGVDRARIVATLCGTDRRRPGDVAEVAEALGVPLLGSVPWSRRAARQAMTSQHPAEKGPLARAFGSLAASLRERLDACIAVREPEPLEATA